MPVQVAVRDIFLKTRILLNRPTVERGEFSHQHWAKPPLTPTSSNNRPHSVNGALGMCKDLATRHPHRHELQRFTL
jgi:hypothetical protein